MGGVSMRAGEAMTELAERREQRNGGGLTGGAAGSGRTVLWGWAGEAEPAALTLSRHSLSPGRAAHTAQTGSGFLLFLTERQACLAVGIGTLRPAGRLAAAPRPHGTRANTRTKSAPLARIAAAGPAKGPERRLRTAPAPPSQADTAAQCSGGGGGGGGGVCA